MMKNNPSEQTVVSKDELIHQVAAKAGVNLKDANEVINAFTEVVRDEISQGHDVRLMGFGTWNLRDVSARKVKSIRGGAQITLPAHKRVGFTVGAVLAQAAEGKKAPSSTAGAKLAPTRSTPKK